MTKKEKKDIKQDLKDTEMWWYGNETINNWTQTKEQFQNYDGTWRGVNYKR